MKKPRKIWVITFKGKVEEAFFYRPQAEKRWKDLDCDLSAWARQAGYVYSLSSVLVGGQKDPQKWNCS